MAERQLALDTNAYSDFIRGNRHHVEMVHRAAELFLPFIVVAELRAGFQLGTKHRRNEAGLRQFLASPRTTVLWPDELTIQHYATLAAELERQGNRIPTNDLWIAALVLQHDLPLLTTDAHFQRLPQITLR